MSIKEPKGRPDEVPEALWNSVIDILDDVEGASDDNREKGLAIISRKAEGLVRRYTILFLIPIS